MNEYQIMEFDLDKELSKEAVDTIFSVLKQQGAKNIELNFTSVKHKDFEKAIDNRTKLSKDELEVYG